MVARKRESHGSHVLIMMISHLISLLTFRTRNFYIIMILHTPHPLLDIVIFRQNIICVVKRYTIKLVKAFIKASICVYVNV